MRRAVRPTAGWRLVLAVLAVTLAYWGCSPRVVIVAADTFDAEVRNGWDSTDSGGMYTLNGQISDFDVTNGVGTVLLRYTATPRAVYLSQLSDRDYRATIKVSTDRPASGGRQFVYLALRRTDDAEYVAKLSFGEGGQVFLEASRLIRVGSEQEASLGPEVLLDQALHQPGGWFALEADVRGVNPTTVRVRAWPDGSEPPGWQLSVTDQSPQLRAPGTVGIRARLGRGVDELPVLVSVDDLRVSQ